MSVERNIEINTAKPGQFKAKLERIHLERRLNNTRRTTRGQTRAETWIRHDNSKFLYKLNPKCSGATASNANHLLPYAPNAPESWYLRLSSEDHRQDLFWNLEDEAPYISLRFLATLGCASVAWEKIQ